MIDTHCHLNDEKAFPDPELIVDAAAGVGVDRLIAVGLDPANWLSAIKLADSFDNLFAIVGWHPNYTNDYSASSLPLLREALSHPKVVAMGEIGLDWYRDYATREQQFEALHDQLDLAQELSVPVVFHAREAYSDLLDVLEARPPHPYLFHCWAGNSVEAGRAVDLGAYFGIDGPITYKKSDSLREVVRQLPHDRLVLETDSPYLSPEPVRGKPNHPGNIPFINLALAAVLGATEAHCAEMTTANAERFFGLARPTH
jgi:TatD DNase family protein